MVKFMYDRREKNALIFKDTEYMHQNNEMLKAVIVNSINQQKMFLADDIVEYNLTGGHSGKVVVSGKRTLEASEL